MKNFILKCIANMTGFYLASLLFPSISVSSAETVIWCGFALGFINLFLRPLLLLVSLPVNIITLGLFTLIINTWLVLLTTRLISGFSIPSFKFAFLTAFLISGVNIIAEYIFRDD